MTASEFHQLALVIGTATAYGRAVNSPKIGERMRLTIPEHCQNGLANWLLFGILPGSFLRAVIANDLQRAAETADEINEGFLVDYARFLRLYAPEGSHGSPAALKTWAGIITAPIE